MTSSFIRTLIQTINEVFEADLLAHNRKRETVDAKRMFSTILRDLGCTYKNIAHMLNNNHATVIYHVKSMRDLMSMEIDLRDKYKFIMDIIVKLVMHIIIKVVMNIIIKVVMTIIIHFFI